MVGRQTRRERVLTKLQATFTLITSSNLTSIPWQLRLENQSFYHSAKLHDKEDVLSLTLSTTNLDER